MIDPKLLIAGAVVVVTLLMLCVGFGLNAYGQIARHGEYTMPADFFQVIKWVIPASIAVLWIGARAQSKKAAEDKKDVE